MGSEAMAAHSLSRLRKDHLLPSRLRNLELDIARPSPGSEHHVAPILHLANRRICVGVPHTEKKSAKDNQRGDVVLFTFLYTVIYHEDNEYIHSPFANHDITEDSPVPP
jgi:hypothetical protein